MLAQPAGEKFEVEYSLVKSPPPPHHLGPVADTQGRVKDSSQSTLGILQYSSNVVQLRCTLQNCTSIHCTEITSRVFFSTCCTLLYFTVLYCNRPHLEAVLLELASAPNVCAPVELGKKVKGG